jgi:glycosyltransferase involved in cell wall biosynthesis
VLDSGCHQGDRATMTISGPLVSVIIPTKNSMDTLPRLLKSISKQNYENKEIIVVDNYSSDHTLKIASKWGVKVLLVWCERSKARNVGAKRAIGEYLLFVDSDMEFSDRVIADCVNVVQTGGYGACVIREITKGEGYWIGVRSLERMTYEGGTLFETAVFFKKDIFFHVGGFDENLVGFEDYDLQVRLEKAGIRIGYSKTPIIHHEGRLMLSKHLMKKRYYVRTGKDYIFRNERRSLVQFLPVRRTFIKNWRILRKRPSQAVGILLLKSLETIVGLISLFV